jgi:hypothetical protein
MTNLANPQTHHEIWVGLWHRKRHVVFDPSIQPENLEYMLLYFVEGHALCARKRTVERKEVTTVHHIYDREFALEQYRLWFSANASIAVEKKACKEFQVENPPPPRKKCRQCDGQPNWFDTVNKPTYGVLSEGPNIIERCPSCNGQGFVNDVLEI